MVLDDLGRVPHFARMKEKQFAAYINRKNSQELRKEISALHKELDSMQRRVDDLKTLFKHLYEDNVLGRVSNKQFRMLSGDYEKAKRFREINELTPELLRLFIQRIEVGERAKKYAHGSPQEIRIYYRDIGLLDSEMEEGEQPMQMAVLPQTKEEFMQLLA